MPGSGERTVLKGDPAALSEMAARPAVWRAPPSKPALQAGAVHVWRASLDLEAEHVGRLEQDLPADERARAARLRFARDRNCFIAARGLLRGVLTLYLDVPARRLTFGYGAHGKPFLAGAPGTLRFNVSHSSGTALVAVARGREIGVDIERAR